MELKAEHQETRSFNTEQGVMRTMLYAVTVTLEESKELATKETKEGITPFHTK